MADGLPWVAMAGRRHAGGRQAAPGLAAAPPHLAQAAQAVPPTRSAGEPLSEPLRSLAESSTDEACVFPSSFLYTGFSCCPLLARPGNDQGAGRAGDVVVIGRADTVTV